MSEVERNHIESIFADVADLPPEERSRAIANACGDDEELRAEIDSLVNAYDSATFYFDDLRDFLPLESMSEILDDRRSVDPFGLVGQTISHFRVVEHLGGGGMGVVYRARDLNLPRDIALKLLPPEMSRSEIAVSRFKQEAIAASSLEHSNIAIVHEVGHLDDGQLFVAMAFYDGETIKRKVDRGSLPVRSVVEYGIGIASGLAVAHRHGIVHRDVKPANVMVTRDGNVKLLDFGVAKMNDVSTLTNTGSVVGTLAYMSPEQVRGEKVDETTDIWSLGLVLYEMLTGIHPFLGDHQQAIIYQILNMEPPEVALHRDDAPAALVELIRECLAKDRSERVDSVEEVVARLKELRVQAVPVPIPRPIGRWLRRAWTRLRLVWRRNPATAALTAGALMVAIIVLVMAPWKTERLDLAVLQFKNLGADPSLVDGLQYVVTSSLLRLDGLEESVSVVPADDIRSENIVSSSDASRIYGVEYVIGGSVRDDAEGLYLGLELVDADEGRIVNDRFVRTPSADIGRIQAYIIPLLTDLLNIEVAPEISRDLRAGATDVSGAYDRYTRARGYLQHSESESDVDAAISLLTAAIQEDRDFALAYAALGEAYLQKYRLTRDADLVDQAVFYGTRARALGANLPEVRVALGITYLETGQYEKAELEFLRAFALEPKSAVVNHNLAKVYYLLDNVVEAEKRYNRAIELNPDHWQYHNGLGILYHNESRHADAAERFREVVRLRADNAWGYNNLGAQLEALGRTEEAKGQYLLAMEVDPDQKDAVAYAHNNIARIYYKQKDFVAAAEWFELAAVVEELGHDNWDQLGNAYHRLGRLEDAREAWERTVEITSSRLGVNPNDREALNYLAEAYAKLDQFKLAWETISRLLTQERVEPGDLLVVAKVHEMEGRRDSAIHYVGRALREGESPSIVEASIWLEELTASDEYRSLVADLAP